MDESREEPSGPACPPGFVGLARASCPYLGRRTDPTAPYAYASSHNVCYARQGPEGQPYDQVRRHYQVRYCLRARDGWSTCPSYRKAVANQLTAPRQVSPTAGMAPRRKRRGHHRRGHFRLGRPLRRALMALTILLLTGVVSWTILRMALPPAM
ncbi:MAG: hypothetical protein QHJ73_10905 [Armatimonadota bacterium]|nr:hypothetical protein [Armatimonadota bacterium]